MHTVIIDYTHLFNTVSERQYNINIVSQKDIIYVIE